MIGVNLHLNWNNSARVERGVELCEFQEEQNKVPTRQKNVVNKPNKF